MEPVSLRTSRLELTLPDADDVDALFEACQDADIQRFTPIPSPYRRSDAEAFVERVPLDWESGVHLTWVIREGVRLIGTIGFYRVDGKGAGEIGYWIAPDARGGGHLREAARAVIDWGFGSEGLGLVRIEWRAVAGNVASARVARALGFRYEGLLRQALAGPRGRDDGWIAGLLASDDRMPQPWPVLDA
ncbi:GNAT family N-acetyltransferase [Microbacterium sp. NPDC058389]|uniref:GNAT family N-acetyltransferase n=1 Tax=Microbacterium sp. NPDC058389 TaxID=3346475 RepID=UPI003660B8C6